MAMHVATSSCAQCASPLVEISLARGASTITMRSCSTCDTRWWHHDGRSTDLGGVLGSIAADRQAARGR